MRTLIVILVLIFVTISSFAATTYLGVECDTNGAVVFPTNFFTGNSFGAAGALTNLDTRGWTNNTGIYGNGVGLTNVTATLPSGVLTNNWNGPRVTITNSSLLVTGAQYIALSNGAARVILTNGTVTASGIGTFVGVDAGNGGGVNCERLNLTIGTTTQSRLACITPWTFVFEGTLAANPATNFTFGTPADATNCSIRFSPNGLHGKTTPTVTFISASGGLEDVIVSGVASATNGVLLQVKPQFTTNFTCTTNLQTYLCNGTNQLVTLPNAAYVPNVIYRFAVTNGWAKIIITNATGAQTIRDGTSLSFTQVGVGSPAFFSDGAHWWPAARTKLIIPNAQFSCSTNIPLTLATTSYAVTFNSTDFNNSQGIALLAGTNVNGFASKMWITNSGQYEFSPSIVINFGGNNTVTTWFKKDDVNIPNSATAIKGAAGGSIRCVTIPFVVSVTNPASYEIWVQSTSTGDSLSIQAAGGAAPNDMPLSPSVICPVKKISDLWP